MQDFLLFLQNHFNLVLPLGIVMTALMALEYYKQQSGAKQISPARLTLLLNHDDAAIVDIRSADQYQTNHIIGSVSLPLNEMKDKTQKLDKFKPKPIVLVCANGIDSMKASTLLIKAGLEVLILQGGIRAWRDANMPLTKSK